MPSKFHSQEVAVVPLALHLLPVVLVNGELEHDLSPEGSDGLQALVASDISSFCRWLELDIDISLLLPMTQAMSSRARGSGSCVAS